MKIKKFLTAFLCCLSAFVFVSSPDAFANWYDDVKSGEWTEIEGDRFVADEFCGVEAIYDKNGSYQCNELIMRFYAEAYGLDVWAYCNTGLVMQSEGYGFECAKSPEKGFVVYSTAAMRGASSDHWAIVKDYSDGCITLFEQNVVWEGRAGSGRKLKYPSDSYYLYAPVSLGLAPPPRLKCGDEPTTKPTTTKPTTTKPTTTKPTTTKPTTTKTTTTKPTTTKPTTTKPTTTKPTVVKTSEYSAVQALASAVREEKTASETVPVSAGTDSENVSPEDSAKRKLKAISLVLAAACAAAVVYLIKKKK